MSRIPVVEHYRSELLDEEIALAERVAHELQAERPDLAVDETWGPFICKELTDGPTLHLDDLGGIRLLESGCDLSFQSDRARLRAGDDDFVASCAPLVEGYEEYCRGRLGLGSVTWLTPQAPRDSAQLAANCWQDDAVRETLLQAVSEGRLKYLHPHRGTRPAWELASLLSREAGRLVKVIAPPPQVTEWVNNKLCIAELSERLFGGGAVPRTSRAANLAKAAEIVRELAEEYHVVTLKLPDSVGGGGNVVVNADACAGRSLSEIHGQLKDAFAEYSWQGECDLLVGGWESHVRCAPSVQLWIPPVADGLPVVEGIFVQDFGDDRGMFIGVQPAEFSDERSGEIVLRCRLLARIFQHWGYVGRCSFDMLLVGETEEAAQLEVLECNGRWGATSLPMTLMNRLFGDWRTQPYAVRDVHVEGLDQVSFPNLLDSLGDDLFDSHTGRGSLILFNPGRLAARSAATVLALGDSWEQAARALRENVPVRLAEIVQGGSVHAGVSRR